MTTVVAAFFSAFAIANAAPAAPLQIPFERYRLENGLEVILSEDRRVPLVAVDLWVHVGSGDESPGRSGFAHLFEHMMFQGAEHIGEDVHFDVLRKLGATSVNGTTNSDRTNYYEVVPQNQLETALWLESDRLGFLLPLLTEKSLQNQRDVVRNERRQRYDNVPYGKERFVVNAALYPEGHPYRYLTIGKHEDIEGASIKDVREFWSTRYTPSNATLALVGDFDSKNAKVLIEKWFGALRSAPAPKKTLPPSVPPTTAAGEPIFVDDPFAKLERTHFVWHGPKNLDDEDFDLGLFAAALGSPGWGRLQRALVIENPLCESVAVYEQGQALSGSMHVVATLKPGSDRATVEAIIRTELKKAIDEGITEVEINRARLRTEAAFVFELDELLNRAERLHFFNHEVGDPGYSATYLERLRKRTPATVQAAARKWLRPIPAVVVTRPAKAPPAASPAVAPPKTEAPKATVPPTKTEAPKATVPPTSVAKPAGGAP